MEQYEELVHLVHFLGLSLFFSYEFFSRNVQERNVHSIFGLFYVLQANINLYNLMLRHSK